jgi:hypothetical protein
MLTRMAYDDRTRSYMTKTTREGKTLGETSRMLKRYIAREVVQPLTCHPTSGRTPVTMPTATTLACINPATPHRTKNPFGIPTSFNVATRNRSERYGVREPSI